MIRRFARPYAKAIMELAASPDAARAIHGELARFEATRAGSADLAAVFENPAIDEKSKVGIVGAVAAKLGLGDMTRRTLGVLVGNDRINDLESVLEALNDMINTATSTVVAEVRSAHALGDEEKASLKRALEKRLGRNVQLQLSQDSTLLGGFVATVGSEVFDASIVGRIEKFRKNIA
jgi:F-type H+-transporting ATPase subunit delta